MLEIEEQLRRYADAVEEKILAPGRDEELERRPSRTRGRRWLVPVAAVALVGSVAAIATVMITSFDDDTQVSTDAVGLLDGERAGVFSTPTNTVLLVSDGIDGVTAIDLDRRLAGRRVIEGERAGDQPARLTLTDDHLVVGWGEIYAAPLDGGPSTKIADATIYLPAAEPGEVWTLTWEGGRIDPEPATLRRVQMDGTVTVTVDGFDFNSLEPSIGVPGGLLVRTADGLAVWDAEVGDITSVLGPGLVSDASSNGKSVVWCKDECDTWDIANLDHPGPPTAPHIGRGRIALSPDGAYVARLRRTGASADLVVARVEDSGETVIADDLGGLGTLQWTQDGQLFYTEYSYGETSARIGRYDTESGVWEDVTVPVGDGVGAIALSRGQAQSFFVDDLVSQEECPSAGGGFPSGREGTCTFAFFTPDSPDDCVAEGSREIEVPDGAGLSLADARILMQRVGLRVVGTGAPTSDPAGPDAVVKAQEPPAGSTVPVGACIGFRTDS